MLKSLFYSKYIGISLIVIIVDIITKKLAVDNLTFGYAQNVFSGFNLTLTHNYGMAFGILNNGQAWSRWLLTILACFICLVLLKMIAQGKNAMSNLGLCLILGGALGNVIDRFHYGYVIDFIEVYVLSFHWPSFNVADAAISIGAGLIAIVLIKEKDA